MAGRFIPLDDDEVIAEIRVLIDHLEGIRSTLTSDHIMNLLQDVQGQLPDDKQTMLATIDRYLALPEEERLLYRLGRRGGALRSPEDLGNVSLRLRLEKARDDLLTESGGNLEQLITELGNQYI